jgi:hypothetical protein
MANQRKMVNLSVEETSGVDHPAHLHEGWIIKKSAASAATVEQAFGSLNTTKEASVPELKKNEDGTVTLSQADYDALLAAKPEAPADGAAPAAEAAPEGAAPAAAETAPEGDAEAAEKALIKSMPPAVQAMLKAQSDALAKAQADIAKERDTRLDGEAISKARDTFKSLAIDVTKAAPALRRVALIDPELAKSVETALKAADAQLATAGVITAVVGKSEAGTGEEGAYAQLTAKARELHAAGTAPTFEQAFAKAVSDNPELYKAYNAEKAGK